MIMTDRAGWNLNTSRMINMVDDGRSSSIEWQRPLLHRDLTSDVNYGTRTSSVTRPTGVFDMRAVQRRRVSHRHKHGNSEISGRDEEEYNR